MTLDRAGLIARFRELAIAHTTHEHAPVMTVAESEHLHAAIPGVHTKNLFLRDEKGTLFLVSAPHERRIDLKTLHRHLGCKRLSFGSPELMRRHLGVEPGAVTAFAAVNDTDGAVTVVLDRWLAQQPLVNFHPLENRATTTVSAADLLRFLEACGHKPRLLPLDALPAL